MEVKIAIARRRTFVGMIIGAGVGVIVGFTSGIGMGLAIVSFLATLFVGIGGAVIGASFGFWSATSQVMPTVKAVKLAILYGIALIVGEALLIGVYIGLLTVLDPYLPQTVGDFISTIMMLVSLLVLLLIVALPPMLAKIFAQRYYP